MARRDDAVKAKQATTQCICFLGNHRTNKSIQSRLEIAMPVIMANHILKQLCEI